MIWTVKYKPTPANTTGLIVGHEMREAKSRETFEKIFLSDSEEAKEYNSDIKIVWIKQGDHMPPDGKGPVYEAVCPKCGR